MNAAIEELKEDGTLDKIMANYIGDDQGSYQYETRKEPSIQTVH